MDETKSQSARLERRGTGAREPRLGQQAQGRRPPLWDQRASARAGGMRGVLLGTANTHTSSGPPRLWRGAEADAPSGSRTAEQADTEAAEDGAPPPLGGGTTARGPSDFLGNGHNGKWMQCAPTTLYDVMAGLTVNTVRSRA